MVDQSQYVTLGADTEVFAIPVANVKEILDMQPIVRLPHAPPYLLGMINVRGEGVPVIDLRCKLGLQAAEPTTSARILVLDVMIEECALVLGLLVDKVFEVTSLDEGRLDPPPAVGQRWDSGCISGIGSRHNTFVIVLDLPNLFRAEDCVLSDLLEQEDGGGDCARHEGCTT